ncbi:hypothetical protein C8J57DRAFT_1124276 [Mycena rebaudengoi]|nr:hypothetical protein C8J57DRAFT_1124276 [Mycena rebaudengoi]
MTGILSPASLGQVCQNWREIAFDTPWLWRAIELDLWSTLSFEVFQTWLSRSRGCSLSLSLEKSHTPRFSELPHFTDTIISHSARWEYVNLALPVDQLDWIAGPYGHSLPASMLK